MKLYTVAHIARRTGITVRTLHHYEAEGLLVPAQRSEKGYRLYGATELRRLQHVLALKTLGLSLTEIRQCLADGAPDLDVVLRQQIDRLRGVIVRQTQLLERIEAVADRAERGGTIDAESLLSSIEALTMMEQYFTGEQRAFLQQRRAQYSPERIKQMKEAWRPMIPAFANALKEKKDPKSMDVQILARRWLAVMGEVTPPKDPALQQSMEAAASSMLEHEGAILAKRWDIDPDVFQYICAALKPARLEV